MGGCFSYKRNLPLKVFYIPFAVIFSIFSFASLSLAAETVGKFISIEGKVDVLRGGMLPAKAAKKGDPVQVKDIVRTKSNAKAEITFKDGNIIRIAPRSRINISEYTLEKGIISLPTGKIEAVVKKQNTSRIAASHGTTRFEIRTPNAIAGVRGTDYFVYHNASITSVIVKEGSVYTYSPEFPKDIVVVTAGTITTVEPKKAPQQPRGVTQSQLDKHQQEMVPVEQSSSAKQNNVDNKDKSSPSAITGLGAASKDKMTTPPKAVNGHKIEASVKSGRNANSKTAGSKKTNVNAINNKQSGKSSKSSVPSLGKDPKRQDKTKIKGGERDALTPSVTVPDPINEQSKIKGNAAPAFESSKAAKSSQSVGPTQSIASEPAMQVSAPLGPPPGLPPGPPPGPPQDIQSIQNETQKEIQREIGRGQHSGLKKIK